MSDLSAALEILSQYARRLFRVVSAVCEEVDFFFAVILFFSKGLVFLFAFLKEQNSRAKN